MRRLRRSSEEECGRYATRKLNETSSSTIQLINRQTLHTVRRGVREVRSSIGVQGIIGHSAFSESPVYVGTVNDTVLRIWEYDRMNGTVWSVDMAIDDDGVFWVHPTVRNPTENSINGYWWTCVAMSVDEEGMTRVVSNADMSLNEKQCSPFPYGGTFTL